jgi:transcriptional regulator with XRE-family HTH domain
VSRAPKLFASAGLDHAQRAGISQNSLSAIETGKKHPRPATIRKIAEALGVDPPSLVGDEKVHG